MKSLSCPPDKNCTQKVSHRVLVEWSRLSLSVSLSLSFGTDFLRNFCFGKFSFESKNRHVSWGNCCVLDHHHQLNNGSWVMTQRMRWNRLSLYVGFSRRTSKRAQKEDDNFGIFPFTWFSFAFNWSHTDPSESDAPLPASLFQPRTFASVSNAPRESSRSDNEYHAGLKRLTN